MDISVVVPTYNRYEFLKRALTSVYAQSYQPKEVIVIDDGSNDDTKKIQKDFPNIKYIYQDNKGVSSARNLGIQNSTHEWIAFLDSDDEWHKDKLLLQVELHQREPYLLMSYTDEQWIRDGVEVKLPKKYKKYGGYIFERCLSHCIIAPSSVLIHKNIFDRLGVFDESLEVCEDYDLWLRLTLNYEVGLCQKSLITKYAGHDNQLSFKFWGMDRFRVKALEKLFNLNLDAEKLLLVREYLFKKYSLLLKGAIKYDRIQSIKEYEIKMKSYKVE